MNNLLICHVLNRSSFQRVILNFTPGPQGTNFTPRGELCPLGKCSPLRSPPGVNTHYCLEEWRGEQRISPPGDNFTPGPRGQLRPRGQSLPLGARMGLWQLKNSL
jgi:hypothetical protein